MWEGLWEPSKGPTCSVLSHSSCLPYFQDAGCPEVSKGLRLATQASESPPLTKHD